MEKSRLKGGKKKKRKGMGLFLMACCREGETANGTFSSLSRIVIPLT